jgi:hypothetical protein
MNDDNSVEGDGALGEAGVEPLVEAVNLDDAITVLNALSSAWSTFRLYPDPGNQPAFARAIEMLADVETLPVSFEVGAGSLSVDGEELAANRAGVEQLATRLFVHDVARLTLLDPPLPEELTALFEYLALEETDARGRGGLGVLTEEMVALDIGVRGVLEDELDPDAEGDDEVDDSGVRMLESEVAVLVDQGATPDSVADHLLQTAAGDDEAIRDHYVRAFRELHVDAFGGAASAKADLSEMLVPYWVDDLGPSPAGTLVEVFFRLPQAAQVKILASFLEETQDGANRMFLDQFSGDELSELARQLEPAQSETLIEYARDAAETEDDSTDKIFSLLTSARDIRETRQAAAENVGSQLDDFAAGSGLGGLADEIRLSLKPDSIETHGREVLRGIFASVNRPERFARLLRIWGGRVVQHLRQQEYGRAIDVVEIVRKDPPYDPGFEESVVGAVARLVTRPLLDGVVAAMDTDDRDVSIRFLATLGPPATRRLIEVLADEQDGSRRRPLIDLLTVLGREDPKPLLSSLSDPRWYVVRNVASVLGKAGSSAAVKPLKRVLHHDDGRVRVEVLRALQPLAPEDAPQLLVEALRDEDERVRHAAVTLIRASKAEGIDGDLVTAFESGELDEQTMNKLAQVLAQSGSPLAREALEAAAGKKLALKGGDRTARNAARAALNRGAS